MKQCDVKVSICCLTYNHEKYIRQALDSFLMQKTNFEYEILIHDDASTDKTPDIIREYEKKHPNIIKPIYQTENQYSQGIKVSWKYQFPRAKGKYIAICEGDDFWCDENKLQLQYDALEKHKAVFCTHKVRVITEFGEKMDKTIPNIAEDLYLLGEDFLCDMLIDSYTFQTSSYMFRRNSIVEECNTLPDFIKIASVGDMFLMMLLSTKGDIYYINREMSCYRRFSVSSWTLCCETDKNFRIKQDEQNCKALELFDVYTDYHYHEFICKSIKMKEFILLRIKEQYRDILTPPYIEYYKRLPIKIQIYILCGAIMPKVVTLYRKLKQILQR